ncbi:MAG: phosphatidylserine decarboxylase family protein [Flavobacteriales bacterium]|nr:phosphatidylserine decarboxylase family protein [Flavobacteriales bacterium]MBL0034770.1 phosphatidylserine decarboxylase family protein [Flavobacteriales bacterium]
MTIHREGMATIGLVGSVLLFTALLLPSRSPEWVFLPILGVLIAVMLIVLWFFRVPSRTVKQQDDLIISPADGKVVAIEEVTEGEYFKDRRIQVSVFMSPLNVHVNFFPIGGTTSYYKYHPGKYLVAWHPKSSTENERSTVVVRHPKHGEVLFRQIAGALARRICTYAVEGQPAAQGTEFGFIKFGSRVDLLLPLNADITCRLGDVVQGSITPLARFAS